MCGNISQSDGKIGPVMEITAMVNYSLWFLVSSISGCPQSGHQLPGSDQSASPHSQVTCLTMQVFSITKVILGTIQVSPGFIDCPVKGHWSPPVFIISQSGVKGFAVSIYHLFINWLLAPTVHLTCLSGHYVIGALSSYMVMLCQLILQKETTKYIILVQR